MTGLMFFGGFFIDRFNYSKCTSKTRHKYVPVGSLMPSMALNGLGCTLRTVKSQCQYRVYIVLVYLVPTLSALASCFALTPASMQSCMGMHIGFRMLAVRLTTGTVGTRMRTYLNFLVTSYRRYLFNLIPMLRVGMHTVFQTKITSVSRIITTVNLKLNRRAESLC